MSGHAERTESTSPVQPACIASWEAVEELGDNCPLCGRACYVHELEEDRDARNARAAGETP